MSATQPQPRLTDAPEIKMMLMEAAPGDAIALDGQNFGASQGSGYVHFADDGVNWGAPGNLARLQYTNWSDSQISFVVPVKDSNGYQTTPGTTATVTVTNSSGLNSNTMSLKITAPAPKVKSVSPAAAAPGDTITIDGQGFGATQDNGYVHFADNGVNWGAPGNVAQLQYVNWSDTQIAFVLPEKDSAGFQTTSGTTATVTVTNGNGGATSNAVTLTIKAPPAPSIKSISPATGAPGATIVIDGQDFGATQGSGYVHFANNNINWGEPGNAAKFQLLNWSDRQIAFLVPGKDSQGYQVTPGLNATVTVTNNNGLTSNSVNLALTTAVNWPVSVDSGQTQIGTTGKGFMQTTVTIEGSGPLTASTHIWDKSVLGPLTGFHGATAIALYDSFGNVINSIMGGPWGIEGGQDETKPWTSTVSQEVRAVLYAIKVVNFYDPQYNAPQYIVDWIKNNGPALAAVAATIVAIAS